MNKTDIKFAVDWLHYPPSRFWWDCNRTQIAAQAMGLDFSKADAYRVWEWWSSQQDAQWLSVPTDPKQCDEALREALETLVDRWRTNKEQHERWQESL